MAPSHSGLRRKLITYFGLVVPKAKPKSKDQVLKGWGQIAEFLGQTVSVAQRWQQSGNQKYNCTDTETTAHDEPRKLGNRQILVGLFNEADRILTSPHPLRRLRSEKNLVVSQKFLPFCTFYVEVTMCAGEDARLTAIMLSGPRSSA